MTIHVRQKWYGTVDDPPATNKASAGNASASCVPHLRMHQHPLQRGIAFSLIVAIAASLPMSVAAQEPPKSPEVMIVVESAQLPVFITQPPQEAVTSVEIASVIVTPTPTPTPTPAPTVAPTPLPTVKSVAITGSKTEWMAAAGIPQSDWAAVDFIIDHESSWRVDVVNAYGCIGLGQSCPNGSGLAADCPDWRTNPVCQLRHFSKYAERYGGWQGSYQAWVSKKWW